MTDAGLEHLKGLTKLQSLNLRCTKVTDAGLEHLKGLTNSNRWTLGTKVTDAGLEHLKGLTKLQSLDLWRTQVTDAGLEHLIRVDPTPIAEPAQTQVTDAGLEHLKGLTQLQSLVLAAHRGDRRRSEASQGLTQLQSLDLADTKVTDAGLKHLKGLTHLQSLSLWRTQVTDTGLEHLKGLANLHSLNLRDTKVTGEGVKKLQQALPTCKIEHENALPNSVTDRWPHSYQAKIRFNEQGRGQPQKQTLAPELTFHAGQWAFASIPYPNDKTRLLMVTIAASPEGQPVEHTMQVLVISGPNGKKLTKEDTDRLLKAARKHVSNGATHKKTEDLSKGSTFTVTGSMADKRLLDGQASIQIDGNGKFALAQPDNDADYSAWKSPTVMFASESTGRVIITKADDSKLEIETTVSPIEAANRIH